MAKNTKSPQHLYKKKKPKPSWQRVFVSVMCVILAAVMILGLLVSVIGSPRAYAVSQSEINALKDKKSEITKQKNAISVQIAELEQQQASVLEQKAALDEQNELTRQEIELINEQIELYENLVSDAETELDAAVEAEEKQVAAFRRHIRAMEEKGIISYIEILFRSRSFADLLSRLDDISDIMTADKRLKDECVAARAVVEAAKAEYEQAVSDREAAKVELLEKKRQLEADIEAAYKRIAALEEDIEAATEEYTVNEQAEAEFQAQIDKLMAELKKQEEEAERRRQQQLQQQQQQQQQQQPAAPVVTPAVGNFIWPYPQNNYVGSGYGMRFHPIFQENRMHYGVDIGGTAGQQIVAIASGTVSVATLNSSYGNYVMISHGNGTASLYAHMEKLAVSAGDTVTQGQVIGYCGSTGWSTGPHLHFEIRVNGATTDPLAYYSAGTYIKGF